MAYIRWDENKKRMRELESNPIISEYKRLLDLDRRFFAELRHALAGN